MELVPGDSLDSLLKHTPPATRHDFVQLALRLAEVAWALSYAHGRGVIHRDIKPSNLLQTPNGPMRIGDFGLVRVTDETGVTLTEEILGSPAYMSPEQASGRFAVDGRSDLYSLGVTLYELTTHHRPFEGVRREELLMHILHKSPLPPSRWSKQIPYDLETICLHAIEKDRNARYQTASEIAIDLERFCAGKPIAARRPSISARLQHWARQRPALSLFIVAVFVLVTSGGYFVHRTRRYALELQLQDAVGEALQANMSGDSNVASLGMEQVAQLDPRSGWVPFLKGHLAFQRGDYDAAVEHLQQAEPLLPDSMAPRALLAAAYVGAGWWERYEDLLDDLEKATPKSAEDFMFRGLAESYLDPQRARKSLDEAIQRRGLAAAYVMRGEVCGHLAMDTGSSEDAEDAVQDSLVACVMLPNHPAALLGRLFTQQVASNVYEGLQKFDRAQSLLSSAEADASALEPYSHLPSVAQSRAWFYLYHYREEEAFDILKKAVARSGNSRIAYRYALLLYRRGRFAEGFSLLDQRPQRSHNEELLRLALLMELPGGRSRVRNDYAKVSAEDGLASVFQPAILLMLGDSVAARSEYKKLQIERLRRLPPLRRSAYERLIQFHCGLATEEDLLDAARTSLWDQCEFHFFIGLTWLANGNRHEAAQHFREAVATRCYGFLACDWSQAFLIRMDEDEEWPKRQ